jgi:hypothetical protein
MTLIAAWKLPVREDDSNPAGIRLIADSLLSQPGGGPITPIWKKVYVLEPRLSVPRSARDEDGWELISRWDTVRMKPVGMFFAGNSLAFTFAQVMARELTESLGLKAIYEQAGKDEDGEPIRKHTETRIVRGSDADSFSRQNQDNLYEPIYHPPPRLNIEVIAKLICEELDRFYASIPSGAYVFGHEKVQYDVTIGLAGYCDATSQFRLFEIKPQAEEGAEPAYPIVRTLDREVSDDELLLIGVPEIHEQIAASIQVGQEKPKSAEDSDAEHLSMTRQAVIEELINGGKIKGVGGALVRGEVTRDDGFRVVDELWNPAKAREWRELF